MGRLGRMIMPLIPWNGTEVCGNCGFERIVRDGLIEKCPVCGDEEIDVAAAEMVAAEIPVVVEDQERAGERLRLDAP